MNIRHSNHLVLAALTIAIAVLPCPGRAAEIQPSPVSAKELADRLSSLQDGTSYVRFRLEVKQPADANKVVLQLQIKERHSGKNADVLYQVLWPKELKGEAVLLHRTTGNPATGSLLIPPNKLSTLNGSQMGGPRFGSDLTYQDVIENFFAWENQAIVGNEVLNRVSCLILESKPGRSEPSTYASVRSWIDPRRLVPLRVEKYLPSGRLARRIDTTRIVTDDKGRAIPADLMVRGSQDSVTELEGSRIKYDVAYVDRDFTPEALGEITAPPGAPE
jgi:hypothetical protein